MTYIVALTQQNDTLDALCYRTLGRTDILENVVSANPHALATPVLPSGIEIHIPDLPKPRPIKTTIKLWD